MSVSEPSSSSNPSSLKMKESFQKAQNNSISISNSNDIYRYHIPCSLTRTVILRSLLIVSLLAAVTICTAFSFIILRDAEQEVGRQTYASIASSALTGAEAITLRKFQGSEVIATLMSHIVPDKENWPLVNFDGYIPIAEKVAQLSSSTTQSFMVLLDPDQVSTEDFEAHTKQVYIDQGRPAGAGVSDFGFGMWRPDYADVCEFDDCRLHDSSTTPAWGGKRGILAPLMMHNKPAAGSSMYNLYSQMNRGIHIDSMFDCVDANTNTNTTSTETPTCAVITDMLELKVRPGPAGLIFQPIFPANDPTTFVGFATTSVHWEETLTSVVPDYVNGLTCVVSTDTASFTYEIQKGIPILMGDGDLHDDHYTSYARSIILNTLVTGATSSAPYTLTVYPTAEMLDEFSSNSPVAVSLGFFGVVAFCAFIFFLYDHLMRHEANQRNNVLEMKRRFVRFISHEIRTPLNTVCMGLELLESELRAPSNTDSNTHSDEEKVSEDDVDFCYNITADIKENALTAVEILNDLLNYDKLETGTMKLETGAVPIMNFVKKAVHQFQIQAVNRKIDLKLTLENSSKSLMDQEPTSLGDDLEAGAHHTVSDGWTIVGDDVRLGQVMRNVISNALKFTPSEGCVEVTVTHVVNGLPDAKSLHLSDEAYCTHPRAGSIRICLKDTGIGLSKEQLDQLFSEGLQFDANRLQHGGGSGLGLSIAKGIVEQHSGTICAESEGQGHGTSFIIELPLYGFTPEELEQEREKNSSDTPTDNTATTVSCRSEEVFCPKRILVVEDSVSSLKMLIRLLERAGHSCVGAVNGQEAIFAVKADLVAQESNPRHVAFNTVLIDFEMPIIKGPEATREIRNMGYTGTVVGVTGNVLSEDVDLFKEHGADDVLGKPISMARIEACWDHRSNNNRASVREENADRPVRKISD